ncbi:MAG: DmsE family decaheme c-type cytochrome [Lysobacterales bacterium]|jgi:DmsE family decaheme c-type cytochrome
MKKNASIFSQPLSLIAMVFIALIVICTSPGIALADEGSETVGEYTGMAPQICLNCHGETSARPAHEMLQTNMARNSNPDSPFGEGNHACESCHGPSKAHVMAAGQTSPGFVFDETSTSEEKNAVCMDCHANDKTHFNWPGATHNIEGLACVNCHSVHNPDDPVLTLETQPEVCFGCHKEQRAQFLRQSHHAVQASSNTFSHTGLLTCTDCHNPHGSDGPSQLKRSTVNETCYDCHAEKRGPFLWEHAPVREDCTNCHTPHGSNYEPLLKGPRPWLCQQCHIASFHPSGVYSGSGLPPEGADQRILGKSCLDCHSQVHGSNHPSGIRLTR